MSGENANGTTTSSSTSTTTSSTSNSVSAHAIEPHHFATQLLSTESSKNVFKETLGINTKADTTASATFNEDLNLKKNLMMI